MLLLTGTTDLIQLVTAQAVTVDVQASWLDEAGGTTVTPGRTNTLISTAATTTVVGSPAASTYRVVRGLSVRNRNASVAVVVTVRHTDGTNVAELVQVALGPGETLSLKEAGGWEVIDSDGGLQNTATPGRLLRASVLTAGTSYTTSNDTNKLRVRMAGGGGQGGGCTVGSASISGAAGGGAAGGYAEKVFGVSPNTAYAYAVGAGGSTGGTGAVTGQAGGDTTFTVGATTVTAKGGPGGVGCTSAAAVTTLGGAAPAVSTNGDVNGSGAPGGFGFVSAVGVAASGAGGSGPFGAGGNSLKTQGTGNAGVGNGSGGGGGCTISTTGAVAGGAGTGGCVVIEEYS